MNPYGPLLDGVDSYRPPLDGRGATKHVQVVTSRPGVYVDVNIRPLIEALWMYGFDTQFSCQDAHRWSAPSGRAIIVFARFADAVTFARLSAEWLMNELVWTDPVDHFRIEPAKPWPDDRWRGFVEFPKRMIDRLAQLWADYES